MLSLKEKVISCAGNVNAKSAAIMCGCTYHYVHYVWTSKEIEPIKRSKYNKYGNLR